MTLRLCIIASALLVFAGCASKDSNSPANSNSPGTSTTTASPSTNSSASIDNDCAGICGKENSGPWPPVQNPGDEGLARRAKD